jgi:polar amino acid transport system substrate-binding protein
MNRKNLMASAIVLCASTLLASCDRNSEARGGNFRDVVAVKEIRCGYVVAPPHVSKNPNDGKISGIIPDVIEGAAKNLGYKVKWVEEVGWGTMVEGLKADRYDAVCTAVWPSAVRAQFTEFSAPLYYSGVGVFVRDNDHRFDSNLQKINVPAVKIATTDGEISQIIANQDFQSAARVESPQMSDISQLLMNVEQNKADVAFVEESTAAQYMAAHPGKLRNLVQNNPLRVYANTIMFAKGNVALKNLFDVAVSELQNSGEINAILKRDGGGSKLFYPVARPYQAN